MAGADPIIQCAACSAKLKLRAATLKVIKQVRCGKCQVMLAIPPELKDTDTFPAEAVLAQPLEATAPAAAPAPAGPSPVKVSPITPKPAVVPAPAPAKGAPEPVKPEVTPSLSGSKTVAPDKVEASVPETLDKPVVTSTPGVSAAEKSTQASAPVTPKPVVVDTPVAVQPKPPAVVPVAVTPAVVPAVASAPVQPTGIPVPVQAAASASTPTPSGSPAVSPKPEPPKPASAPAAGESSLVSRIADLERQLRDQQSAIDQLVSQIGKFVQLQKDAVNAFLGKP